MVCSPGGAVGFRSLEGLRQLSNHLDMSKSSTRIRANGAYVIKSAESRPEPIRASRSLNDHTPVVTPEIKKLVEAVWQHRRVSAPPA
jgi:hypothetical protein